MSMYVCVVYRTQILLDGRPPLFKPCDSKLLVTDSYDPVFELVADDNKRVMSVEDGNFLT